MSLSKSISDNSRHASLCSHLLGVGNPLDSDTNNRERPTPVENTTTDHPDQLHIFTLTLRPLPGWHTSPLQRLRLALKCLLRGFGLRCIHISTGHSVANATTEDGQ